MAATLPLSSGVERGLALVGLCLFLRRGFPRTLFLLALVVGVAASIRIELLLGSARALDGYEGEIRLRVDGDRRRDSRKCWVETPDGRAAPAWLSARDTLLDPSVEAVARVRLWIPPNLRNPDDRGRWRQGLASGGLVQGRLLGEGFTSSRARTPGVVARVRGSSNAWLERLLSGSAGLWKALLLADRSDLPQSLRDRLQRLGLSHLLALSGLHVGLLFGAALFLRPRRPPSLWLLLPLATWVLVAGGGPSLMRAATMVGWMIVGRRLQRRSDAADALALSAWVECCLWPWRIAAVGWWLSYGATLALLRAQPVLRRLPKFVALALLSLVAQCGGAPWALASFGQWPWIAPLSNLSIGLVFAPFMLFCCLLLLAAALLPWLSPQCAALVQGASHCFAWLLHGAAALAPEPLGHPGISGASWGLAIAAWFCVLVPSKRLKLRAGVAVLCCLLPHLRLLAPRAPEWWSLDVGQGDAGVYRNAGGQWLVVDLGPAFEDYSAARSVVAPFLRRRNARRVHLLFSHGHRDHCGGARDFIGRARVSDVYAARADSGQRWTEALLDAARANGSRWHWLIAGDSLSLGPERLPVLWPPARTGDLRANDRSVVLALGPAHAPILLAGDAEWPVEDALLRGGGPPGVRLLKLGHHGADTSSQARWLERLGPEHALISCSVSNRYGHPHPATLQRLRDAGITAWRTDRQGAIRVRWSRRSYRVRATAGSSEGP